jgi:hypothetical protein
MYLLHLATRGFLIAEGLEGLSTTCGQLAVWSNNLIIKLRLLWMSCAVLHSALRSALIYMNGVSHGHDPSNNSACWLPWQPQTALSLLCAWLVWMFCLGRDDHTYWNQTESAKRERLNSRVVDLLVCMTCKMDQWFWLIKPLGCDRLCGSHSTGGYGWVCIAELHLDFW